MEIFSLNFRTSVSFWKRCEADSQIHRISKSNWFMAFDEGFEVSELK